MERDFGIGRTREECFELQFAAFGQAWRFFGELEGDRPLADLLHGRGRRFLHGLELEAANGQPAQGFGVEDIETHIADQQHDCGESVFLEPAQINDGEQIRFLGTADGGSDDGLDDLFLRVAGAMTRSELGS